MVASDTRAGSSGAASAGVFISYARADAKQAVALEALLSGPPHNLRVWRDKNRLLPGEHVDFAIPAALRNAAAAIVLWSAKSVESDWVRHEASYAVIAGKAVTLALTPFDYGTLPSVYRSLNCGDFDAILADPTPLFEAFGAIAAASKPPPPRRIDTRQLPRPSNAFIAREKEMSLLQRAWSDGEPKVLALIAAGGTGKTALANAFLDEMAEVGWGGAEAVFAFSFDSQGTDEKRQGSSDQFFSEALTFFGEDPQAFDSVRKRAHRLADILEQQRVLLILDGIEPMQSPRGDAEHGRLRDDAMADFLREIARDNKGLCVVTTRLPIPDLASHRPEQVVQIRLKNLPLSDSVALLRSFKINFPQGELEALAREFGQVVADDPDGDGAVRCHAKAIALIGSFLARRFAGATHAPTLREIRSAFAMPDDAFLGRTDAELKEEPGYAVYKMIRRYEILYEDRARASRKALVASAPGRQLVLLRVMGLFDRPATWGAFLAVLAKPEIPGLTERLDEVTPGEWREAVSALRADGLLNPTPDGQDVLDEGRIIDAHPLVREYFGRRLAIVAPEAWQAAHGRLYDYYRFRGLQAFREPVAYGVLATWSSIRHTAERQGESASESLKRIVAAVQTDPKRAQELRAAGLALSVATATHAQLGAAAKLIGGPEWDEARAMFLPEAEEAMAPLFAAIAHGCAAGRHDEAFNEVYWPRIARGNEKFATTEARPLRLGPRGHRPFLRRAVRCAGTGALARRSGLGAQSGGLPPCARSGDSPRRWSRCGPTRRMAVEQADWRGAAAGRLQPLRAAGDARPARGRCRQGRGRRRRHRRPVGRLRRPERRCVPSA